MNYAAFCEPIRDTNNLFAATMVAISNDSSADFTTLKSVYFCSQQLRQLGKRLEPISIDLIYILEY